MATNKQPSTVDLEEGSSQGTDGSFTDDGCIVLWTVSAEDKYRCIYRVPCWIKRVNPEAYTPQILLIGPLHESKKNQAHELSKSDCRYLGYLKMEKHKKKYLKNFADKFEEETVQGFRNIIKEDEKSIRGCYAESTKSINSDDFVKMMLLDSVFILMFFLQIGAPLSYKTGNFIIDEPCHQAIIMRDLILLENQLPYFLLEKLFDPFIREYLEIEGPTLFRELILGSFGFTENIKEELKFLHFTDLFRRAHVQTLGFLTEKQENKYKRWEKKHGKTSLQYNAVKLDSAGVKFIADTTDSNYQNVSLKVTFDRGILKMPYFEVQYDTETILRNIIALEQCHYFGTPLVSNYIGFLNYLIDTEEDVELLMKKGVIKEGRSPAFVAELVNKMCAGLMTDDLYYYDIIKRLNDHYDSSINRTLATLQRVYFKDLWTGTATVAAVVIVILTLIGTVASVLQLKQKDH